MGQQDAILFVFFGLPMYEYNMEELNGIIQWSISTGETSKLHKIIGLVGFTVPAAILQVGLHN